MRSPWIFKLLKIVILLLLPFQILSLIYKAPTVFYSRTHFNKQELCRLGDVSRGTSKTVTCTTAIPQQNIIRVGLSFTEYYKLQYHYQGFSVNVTPTTGTTSSFTVNATTWGIGSSRLSFFIVVIKAQTTAKYIDLINFSCGSTTALDNNNSGARSFTQLISITSSTIFASIGSITLYPFTTSLKMRAVFRSDWDRYDSSKVLDYSFVATIQATNVLINLTAQTQTRIAEFAGMVLIVNPAVITITATQNMSQTINTFSLGSNFNISFTRPLFGPNFNSKCILGFTRQRHRGEDFMSTYFTNSIYGNFQNLRMDSWWLPPTSDWRFFCFGNGTQCHQTEVYIDTLTGGCYTGSTCPLPVFTLWTKTTLCPICTQLICLNCTVTNRSNCLTCGPFSTLVNGACVCDATYIGVYTAISTSTLGMWNNVASSLTSCKIQCSALSGCAANSCTNSTYCTVCVTGYALVVVSASQQYCDDCPSLIANCITCTTPTVCTLCAVGYYITATFTCEACNVPMAQCLTCSSVSVCLTCTTGFMIDSSNLCQCNIATNSLANCLSCVIPTECSACVSNLYYLGPTDSLCYLCSNFDAQCTQCNANRDCTLCNTGYTPQFDGIDANLCVACSTPLPFCSQCSSPLVCTLCVSTSYYLTATFTCESCGVPMLQCLTCTDMATCLTCTLGYIVSSTAANLCVCDPITSLLANCLTCSTPTVCTSCTPTLYFLSVTDFKCHLCTEFQAQCLQCSANQTCTLCSTGYALQTMTNGSILCTPCSTPLPNCIQCVSITQCSLCVSNNYYLTGSAICELCSVPMAECVTCLDSSTCLTCNVGFVTNSSNLCDCDPVINGLVNCLTCTGLTVCSSCVSNLFYVDPTDFHCYVCANFDVQCIQCSAYRVCTLCNAGFIPKPNSDGSFLCVPCYTVINNCTQCSTLTTCTNCDQFYGLTLLSSCMKCDILLTIPYCSTCENLSGCFGCYSPTVLAGGKCYFCSVIYMCVTCFANALDELECSSCQDGYYLTANPLTGKPECKLCMNLVNYCKTCNTTQCFSCSSPYLIGSDNTCSQCLPGYELNSGFCTKIPGCRSIAQLPDGSQICVACIQELNFIFDSVLKKCICAEGFKQYNVVNYLPKCVPNCGDGIIIMTSEECDDKNPISGDGCDSTCKVQPGFVCTIEQPSKCTLHVNFETVTFNYVSRVLGQNTGILSFTINPSHPGLEKMPWDKMVKFNFSSTSVDSFQLRFSYNSATGELRVVVPYSEELESSDLETLIIFDPQYIVSMTPSFVLKNRLAGINAPLSFEPQLMLETQQSINTISLVMTILILLQFYVGSYFHKMIGLETIQVIQSIYFARMVAGSSETSALTSLNIIQYSTSGYHNEQVFYGNIEEIQNHSTGMVAQEFTLIDMKQFFLLNVNLSLIPMAIAVIVYIVALVRKYNARNQYIESKEQDEKDRYTQLRRSCQWVYDHAVFPLIMMFNLISFFQSILLLSSKPSSEKSPYQSMEDQSFFTHIFMLFTTTAILCYEIFNSYEDYSKYRMTARQRERVPKSIIQKLEHDENYPDRANYHPGYVLFYLTYYFVLCFQMIISTIIPNFNYTLQMTLGCSMFYFFVIAIWKPYHQSINIHNHFLKVYYGTFVLFMGICYVFARVPALSMDIYVTLIYVITGLIGIIMVSGFVRIFIEKNFRKSLEGNSSLLEWQNQVEELTQKKKQLKIDTDQVQNQDFSSIKGVNNPSKHKGLISKRQSLVLRNQYAMKNQLANIIRTKQNNSASTNPNAPIKPIAIGSFPGAYEESFTYEQKEKMLIDEMKKQFDKKRQEILFEDKTGNKKVQTPSKQDKFQQTSKDPQINRQQTTKFKENNSYENDGSQLKQSLLEQIKSQMRREWIMIEEED